MMNGSPPKTLESAAPTASDKPSNGVGIGDCDSTGGSGKQPNIPAMSAGKQHSSTGFES